MDSRNSVAGRRNCPVLRPWCGDELGAFEELNAGPSGWPSVRTRVTPAHPGEVTQEGIRSCWDLQARSLDFI